MTVLGYVPWEIAPTLERPAMTIRIPVYDELPDAPEAGQIAFAGERPQLYICRGSRGWEPEPA